jgi:hypothetical protein
MCLDLKELNIFDGSKLSGFEEFMSKRTVSECKIFMMGIN